MGIGTRWFVQTLVAAFVTMLFIWIIKKGADKYQIPVLSQIASEV